ncbi:MAG: Asp-tRNA(Asn)/Glu-tRNA(Gln) amidotransferase subunit GatC [bacterium]|nr:Asp-tRNA(Asn)/Glu-tRNA(Gln) amidotransferase subunit GatC [bacterium]
MITPETVAYLARLARIELNETDLARFVPPLQEILAYVAKLNELDTSQVEPTAHVLPLTNVSRSDDPLPSLSNAAALQSAPCTDEGCFLVPPVIE